MYIILKPKLLHLTKEMAKVIGIVISGFLLVLAIIFIKYKPVYEVTVAGKTIGFIKEVNEFKSLIEKEVINQEGECIANISLIEEPKYELKLLNRTNNLDENELIEKIKMSDTIVTYRYYEVALNNETESYVKSLEEAENVVNKIKEEFSGDDLELNLQISEKYTESMENINTNSLEIATNNVEKVANEIKEEKKKKEEEESALAIINNIKLSVLPVTGRITSRYGESSSIRKSTHTGLDIACTTGTDIKVVSNGTVTFSGKKGSYGNLIIVDHGNGVETWYGHCSKLYAKVQDTVTAGDIVAAVGSTGNSTGPHLHFEIRINGECVNPQKYVY